MKITKDKTIKGVRTVTVQLGVDETILAVINDAYYRLEDPHLDIVHTSRIASARRVYWCDIGQEWVDT